MGQGSSKPVSNNLVPPPIIQPTQPITPPTKTTEEVKGWLNDKDHPTLFTWAPKLCEAGNLYNPEGSNWLITAIKSVLLFLITILAPIEKGLTKFVDEIQYVYNLLPDIKTPVVNKAKAAWHYVFPEVKTEVKEVKTEVKEIKPEVKPVGIKA